MQVKLSWGSLENFWNIKYGLISWYKTNETPFSLRQSETYENINILRKAFCLFQSVRVISGLGDIINVQPFLMFNYKLFQVSRVTSWFFILQLSLAWT